MSQCVLMIIFLREDIKCLLYIFCLTIKIEIEIEKKKETQKQRGRVERIP